jgi:small GTP-binding protein
MAASGGPASSDGSASAAKARPVIEGKVIVIGSVSVGKTCLIGRLTKDLFSGKATPPSIGVSFFQHTIEGAEATLKASLWDTAGQERFRAVSSLYYRQSGAVVLVFDVSNRSTFEDLPVWLSTVREAAGTPHLLIMVVANKVDVPPSARTVSEEEGRAFASSVGALYAETSAQTGKGVREAFFMIADASPRYAALQTPKVPSEGGSTPPGRTPMAGLFRDISSFKRGAHRSSLVIGDERGRMSSRSSCCK